MKLDYTNTIKAISILEEVIVESPDFPLPYLDINQAYIYMGTMGIIPSLDAFTKAQPFITKAIELKEDLPETQLNLAWINCWQKWDLKQAYIHLNNALSEKQTDVMFITMANLLTIEGKLEIAMKYINKALAIAPFSSVNINYKGFLYYMMEEYEKALPYFRQSLKAQPELPFPVLFIGSCHLFSGRQDEGLAYFNSLPEDNTGFLTKLGGTTIAHAMMGNVNKANQGIAQLKLFLETPSAGNALNFMVLSYAQLNNTDEAMNLIRNAIEFHFPMLLMLPTEPLAKSLHKLPAFKKIMLQLVGNTSTKEISRKYKKSLFEEKELNQYKIRVVELMEQEELYLDPELTLRNLAKYMNLPANHMSQLLNEGFQKNFADYVNTYRLENFKNRLKNNSSHHLTLMAQAYDSGFNSKTVFNTFFKRKEGMTPKTFWKQLNS